MKKLALVVLLAVGCGGGYQQTSSPVTTPTPQSASLTGRYDIFLTSTNGKDPTSIFTNFTLTGTTFAGAPKSVDCTTAVAKGGGGGPPVA